MYPKDPFVCPKKRISWKSNPILWMGFSTINPTRIGMVLDSQG